MRGYPIDLRRATDSFDLDLFDVSLFGSAIHNLNLNKTLINNVLTCNHHLYLLKEENTPLEDFPSKLPLFYYPIPRSRPKSNLNYMARGF